MDDSEKSVCSICWDTFKSPKLLPCRHTFCVNCIKRSVKLTTGSHSVKCPLCRTICVIPQKGVDGFMNNYFVGDADVVKKDVKVNCNLCQQISCYMNVCSHCGLNMCGSCTISHKKAIILSGVSGLRSDTESDSDADLAGEPRNRRRRNSTDLPLPFPDVISLDPVRSNKVVSFVSSFVVDIFSGSTDNHFINSICTRSGKECWIIPKHGPHLIRYDIKGEPKEILPLPNSEARDVICRDDGSLLIAVTNPNVILKYRSNRQSLSVLTTTGERYPFGLANLPNGNIAVVMSSAVGKCPNENGELRIYTKTGHLDKCIEGKVKDGSLFKQPFSVTFNKISSSIFVSDRGRQCVFVFCEKGNLRNTYEGGTGSSRPRIVLVESDFDPLDISADIHGHVIVIDGSTGYLHLLDCEGNFLGLVLTNHHGNFGKPVSIAIDKENKIWLGDFNDRKVRVFESEAFFNILDPFVALNVSEACVVDHFGSVVQRYSHLLNS